MKILITGFLVIFLSACSTTTSFKVPEGAELYVHEMKVPKGNYHSYSRKPYSWGTAGGIKYRLVKNGKTIEKGTLKSKFRVVSIFWPPVALAYWPMGFAVPHYDLTIENMMVRPNYVEKKNQTTNKKSNKKY